MGEIPRSLDEGGRLSSAGQGAATARRVARWTVVRSGGDGWVARPRSVFEQAVDGRGVRHDRAHRHAPCAPGASRDVHVQGSAQEGGPIHVGKRRVKRAAKEPYDQRNPERCMKGGTLRIVGLKQPVEVESFRKLVMRLMFAAHGDRQFY